MALRDKMIITLDTKKTVEVEASSPGGKVVMTNKGEGALVRIEEQTAKGRVKNMKWAHIDHIVSIEWESGK